MEVVDETMGSNDQSTIIKGRSRRTKRQRPSSPPLSITMSTSSSTAGGHEYTYMSGESTEEEEDMANCLIMLAQGLNQKQIGQENDKKLKETVTTATSPPSVGGGVGGLYVYECKTCNRCFPSFQALGGHRASHKKPKAVVEEKKAIVLYQEVTQFNTSPPPPPPPLASFIRNGNNNKASKVHECSICGSEFSSGQALGGHMRRHRTSKIESEETKNPNHPNPKPRQVFALDLNLPAPEEDQQSNNNFVFSNQPSMIYSASSLVDCHY